ncbi:MAG: hypothetical protein GY830_07695 [Bacteroidetes bacterium]|nr:hypothetical protein [Bacteroidota bacterium]
MQTKTVTKNIKKTTKRKTKYNAEKYNKLIENYAHQGATNEDIAKDILHVGKTRFYEWLTEFPNLANSLKRGRIKKKQELEATSLKRMESKMSLLARGFKLTEKTEIVDIKMDPKTGTKVVHKRIVTKGKYIPPSFNALKFKMINQGKGKWKDTSHTEHSGTIKTGIDMTEEELNAELRDIESKLKKAGYFSQDTQIRS